MENQLGYKLIDDIKVISTDGKGQGGKEVKGFITTQNDTIYSNDKNQNSTVDTIATLGQEIAGTMQKREGVDITTDREQHNDYQNAIAKDLVNDVAFTLNNNDYKPMAQSNNHVQPKSLEEYSQLQQNNAEFARLDKELGDNAMSNDPRLNVFYGENHDKWSGKISSNFIQNTNKKMGKYTTLLKTDETEFSMLALEYYKLFGGELNFGKVELPNFKSTIDQQGMNIEAGLGYKTIDGRAGFNIEKPLGSNITIKGGVKGSLGGIGANAKLNASSKKVGASGQIDFGVGVGADIEVKYVK